MKLVDRVVVITGAGSGIGRALALDLAKRGNRVAISDVNEEGLERTRADVAALGVDVSAQPLDVSDRDAVYAWADAVERDLGAAHLVVNNAGVALAATLREVSDEDFEWLMNINFWGVVYGTRAFLPQLERQDAGHVVNISSVFGIIAFPHNGTYNAAKFAVRGYTEALRMELKLAGSTVSATCVHPGGIKTNIARSARVYDEEAFGGGDVGDEFEAMARTTPEQCAEQILRGVQADAPRVLVGPDARLIDTIQRLVPTGYQRIVQRFIRMRRGTIRS